MVTKKIVKPSPPARHPFFSEQDAIASFCAYIARGGHMAAFCKETGVKYNTLSDWIYKDAARSAMYARAREERADVLADEIVAISDEKEVIVTHEGDQVLLALDAVAVARNRLRVDARKWAASKLKPRVYGERVETVHSGTMEITQPIEQARAELKRLLNGS